MARGTERGRRWRRGIQAPLAITSTGRVLVNVRELDPEHDFALGDDVFVGVVLSRSEIRAIMKRLDGATAEAVSRVVFQRSVRRRA